MDHLAVLAGAIPARYMEPPEPAAGSRGRRAAQGRPGAQLVPPLELAARLRQANTASDADYEAMRATARRQAEMAQRASAKARSDDFTQWVVGALGEPAAGRAH